MGRFYINVAFQSKHVFRTGNFEGFSEFRRAWDAITRKFKKRAGWSVSFYEEDRTCYEFGGLDEYRERTRREHEEWMQANYPKKKGGKRG